MKRLIVFRRPVTSAVAMVCLSLGAVAIFLLMAQLSGNFHTVIAGELYRSAQPTGSQLERYIRGHGIKTVINLRGASERDWYGQETAVAQQLGVKHIDFKMSASMILSPEKADALIALMKAAPKPILLHCLSGSDRTGIASAIYARQIAGIDPGIAQRQLSLYYGHIAIPYLSAAYAMDESWEMLSRHFAEGSAKAADRSAVILAATATNERMPGRQFGGDR